MLLLIGDFRHLHVRLQHYAESISILKGEKLEWVQLNSVFQKLLGVQTRIIHWQIMLSFLTVSVGIFCIFIFKRLLWNSDLLSHHWYSNYCRSIR